MEHVSHFNQKMAIHANNEALMFKVFPSCFRPVAMLWFDALQERSIGSFEELTKAFGARFITCSRVPRLVDSLLFMAMREGETLKTYSDWYWETYNELRKSLTMKSTLKVGLPTEHELRKSLTMKSALNMIWITQTSTRGQKRIRYKEKVKLKCSPSRRTHREEGIIMIGSKEISLVMRHPWGFNWSIHCLRSQCTRYLIR